MRIEFRHVEYMTRDTVYEVDIPDDQVELMSATGEPYAEALRVYLTSENVKYGPEIVVSDDAGELYVESYQKPMTQKAADLLAHFDALVRDPGPDPVPF